MKRRVFLSVGVAFLACPATAQTPSALDQVNGFRKAQSRAALSWSPVLERAAQAHADDMAEEEFFSHQGSNGSDLGARLSRAGYGWCAAAENIAKGHGSVSEVLDGWYTSHGHRLNMLNGEVTEMGLARGAGNIWVMVLGRPGC